MSRPTADFLVEHAITALTCAGPAPRTGAAPDLAEVRVPALAASAGRIVYAGPADALAGHVDVAPRALRIDATGCSLLPGFVDAVPPEPGGTTPGAPDAGAEWALAHGTTTLRAAGERRAGGAVLAPVDALLDELDEVRPRGSGEREPLALTALSTAGGRVRLASMPYALTVACLGMGLSLAEALAAATINAAWSLGCDAECGSLEDGKRMDVVVVKGPPAGLLQAGAVAVRMVIRGGKLVSWV